MQQTIWTDDRYQNRDNVTIHQEAVVSDSSLSLRERGSSLMIDFTSLNDDNFIISAEYEPYDGDSWHHEKVEHLVSKEAFLAGLRMAGILEEN